MLSVAFSCPEILKIVFTRSKPNINEFLTALRIQIFSIFVYIFSAQLTIGRYQVDFLLHVFSWINWIYNMREATQFNVFLYGL